MSQIDSSIGIASKAVTMSLDAGAQDQIQTIKDNLKYLEDNMIKQDLGKPKGDLTK